MTAIRQVTRMLVVVAALGGCGDLLGIGEFVDETPGPFLGDGEGGAGGVATGSGYVPGTHGWASAFGSAGVDLAAGIGVDAHDASVLAGVISGQVDFGGGGIGTPGESHAFLVRLTADGEHDRSIATRGAGETELNAVAVAANGTVAVVGNYQNGWFAFGEKQAPEAGADADVFVAALDAALSPSFVVGYPAAGEQRAYAVAIDPRDGSVVVGGSVKESFAGVSSSGPDDEDAFILKLDATGQLLWARDWGDADQQRITALAIDETGNIIVAGSFSGTIDFGGGPLAAAAVDAFVAKLNPAGDEVFSRSFGKSASHEVKAVAVGGDAIVVAGAFVGTTQIGDMQYDSAGDSLEPDLFVARMDSAGEVGWSTRFGGLGPDRAYGVALDDSGAMLVSGSYSGLIELDPDDPEVLLSGEGGDDALVLAFAADGILSWALGFGRQDDDRAVGVAIDSAGDALIAGTFGTGFMLDGELVAGVGLDDIFVAKLLL